MESLYSPKTHSFSLFPKIPSSFSPSPSSHFPLSPIFSIRSRQFLGDCHKLRLRSRRKSKPFRFHTARIPIASLNSLPIVAVVVFAALSVSAVAVVYSSFYFPKKRKEGSDDLMFGSPFSGYNQDNIDTDKLGFHRPIAAERLHTNTLKENKHSFHRFGGSTTNDEVGRVNLSSMTSLVLDDMLIVKPTDLPSSKFRDMGNVTPIVPKESNESEPSNSGTETKLNTFSVAHVAESTEVLSVSVDTAPVKDKNFGDSQNEPDECQLQNTRSDFVSTVPVIETGDMSVLVDATPVKIESNEPLIQEHGECQHQVADFNLMTPVPMAEMEDAVSVLLDTASVKESKHEDKKKVQDECQFQESNFSLLSTTPTVEMKDTLSVVDTAMIEDKINEESHREHDESQLHETSLSLLPHALMVEVKDIVSTPVDPASVEDNNREEVISEHGEHPLQTFVSGERMRSNGLYLLYEDMSVNDSPGVLP